MSLLNVPVHGDYPYLIWFFVSIFSERKQCEAAKRGEVYVSRYEAILNPDLTSTATVNRQRRAEESRSRSRSIYQEETLQFL